MNLPEDLKYTTSHEWVRVEDGTAVLGITDHAQDQLGDIVYVDLPEEGDDLKQGEAFTSVESVKAASDCYMPAEGTVKEVNEALEDAPGLVNEDPYDRGWIVRIELDDPSQLGDLLDAAAYAEHLKSEE